jgi:predicted GH43/DUF377 family glycosyl hydrolase
MRSLPLSAWKISFPAFFLTCSVLLFSCGPDGGSAPQEEEVQWAMGPFDKVDEANPCLLPDSAFSFYCPLQQDTVRWAVKDVFNPASVVRGDTLFLVFRAEDSVGRYAGTSRLGLAFSHDGLHFQKEPTPVLYPDDDFMRPYEWEGGCEDPRIVEHPDGRYLMTYTAYDGQTARLCVASSTNLRHWTKHGLAFEEGKYRDLWSKSGSIICRRQSNRLVAEKINGQYWMYWGDKNIHAATSGDGIRWTPLEEGDSLKVVLPYRSGFFDSDLVEPGPPAMIIGEGVLLIYNGRNYGEERRADIPEGTYSAGQVLFSKEAPSSVISRLTKPFFRPDRPYEIEGQVNRVVFLEGLAPFRDQWFLYYGTADSKIAVAVHSEENE